MDTHERHEDLFELAVDLSPAGLLVVDEQGLILLANREIERLFGWSRDELVGQPVEMLVPDRFRAVHPGHRSGFHADPRARPMGAGRDLKGRRRDGSEFPVEIGLNPVPTDRGLRVLASVVDVSARRQLEQQLRHAQKMEAIGTLAGGIAHDFNNVLLAILGYTELAREAVKDPGVRADLDRVVAAGVRGRELVHRILGYSRRRDPARAPIALEPAVREALLLLRATLPATVAMRDRLDPATPWARVDEVDVHQVVLNLATNSAHAMPSGGELEVTLEPVEVDAAFAATHPPLEPGPHARLTVRDTGAGIPADVLDRVFEPFFTTKDVGQGTGLGLSTILGVVNGFAGAITISSRVGGGTRVDVYVPAAPGPGAAPSAPPSAATSGRSRHVILVEDEEVLGKLVSRQLDSFGLRVTTFTSSVAALRAVESDPEAFDLMITDNTMPEMTGFELAGRVHRLRPALPILMVSGVGALIEEAELRAHGIRAVLHKPHTASELALAVEALIAGG